MDLADVGVVLMWWMVLSATLMVPALVGEAINLYRRRKALPAYQRRAIEEGILPHTPIMVLRWHG